MPAMSSTQVRTIHQADAVHETNDSDQPPVDAVDNFPALLLCVLIEILIVGVGMLEAVVRRVDALVDSFKVAEISLLEACRCHCESR